MIRFLRIVLWLAGVLASSTTHGDSLPPWMAAELSAAGIGLDSVAVYVKDPGAVAPLISHNASKPFKPASIIKVLTTYAALEVLGEDYQWQTPVFCSGAILKGELKGDLIFRGVGDPSLSHEKLRELAVRLVKRGIKTIRGDVILDRSFFSFDTDVPSQFYREMENPWNLPPNPLLINGKAVSLTVEAGKGAAGARIRIDPPLHAVRFANNVTLSSTGECRNPKETLAIQVDGGAEFTSLRIGGTLSPGCAPYVRKLSVLAADNYFAESFRASYESLGGKVQGRFRSGSSVSDVRLIGAMRSDPVMSILRETNKNSNNLMARLLFLTIGAELTGRPPSPQTAAGAIHRWIAALVPETRSFALDNGSGLSDEERVTAAGMVALLDHIRNSRYAAQFLDTLPAVGQDGTMRNRLSNRRVAGRSVAKTGTLRDTRAIAGMMVNSQGRPLLYTMIVNHAQAAQSLPIIDKLISWLNDLPARK